MGAALLGSVVWAMAAVSADAAPLARIRLYNPTSWDGPAIVETPIGRLASPGALPWDRVRLVVDGQEAPFALREGLPHWKADLVAPVVSPRSEDLLVFSCRVPPGKWVTVEIVPGVAKPAPALHREAGRLLVAYPGLRAEVDAASGLLMAVDIAGAHGLAGPMTAQAWRVASDEGSQRRPLATDTRLVSSSSTAAMTELNFLRMASDGLSSGLTYRIHAAGLIEIWADERPWADRSPWVDHLVEYALPIAGDARELPYLVNRAPYYGFRDFEAAVKHPAAIHTIGASAAVVELGEETTNGRRWCRRLYTVPRERLGRIDDLIELATEGLVVDPDPCSLAWSSKAAHVSAPPEAAAAAERVSAALRRRGVRAAASGPMPASDRLAFRIADAAGLSGDGYAIAREAGGIGIVARTPFGLTQAAERIAEYLDQRAGTVRLPLIASNPAVDLRAGGFGGGDHEVDFPYGTDAEWEHAFEGMIASGMNAMADLSMWGNWKMPVSYRYMPELRSDSPDAFDQATGARFSEIDQHRDHGLRLLSFLHERGVKVWQWVPVGCVPTTYAAAFPDAMSAKNPAVPCFTHPNYFRYLEAYAKELLETYLIDGIVMIRDDNGGICECERCQAYVAASRTKSAMWEQYLILYDWLRSNGFAGAVGVYPYNDPYESRLDALLPEDLLIIGHGSGAGTLCRSYETLGPMGDTWLDNLFASFRQASTPRMKRLLSDRGSFWIGGAYCGTELPWLSIGYFGWEPTATANSLRYWWGAREFGRERALEYVALMEAYERLWDIYDLPMLPREWVKLGPEAQASVSADARRRLSRFRDRLAGLRSTVTDGGHSDWFAHVGLFGTYFEYHLRRLELLTEMEAVVLANRDAPALPKEARARLLAAGEEVRRLAAGFDDGAALVPGNMLVATRRAELTQPFREWVAGYDALEWILEVKQFAGGLSAVPVEAPAGKPFTLRIELRNDGIWPWADSIGPRIECSGDAQRLGLPAAWRYEGQPLAYGDRREIELSGVAPAEPGEGTVSLSLTAPFRNSPQIAGATVEVVWR